MNFADTDEHTMLRSAVADLAARYGHGYFVAKAKSGGKTTELWAEAGALGYLGVSVPAEYGGGGGGISELAIVCEELAAGGCPLLLLVVSPAICATVIAGFGTAAQKERWLPGFADGTLKMCFAITEPDAGSNTHKISTSARRDGTDWILSGQKYYISGVDECSQVLVVARLAEQGQGTLQPALFVLPADSPGLHTTPIEMEITSPEKQFTVFLDDVRVPADALLGESAEAGLPALFAGLNPERIAVASFATGIGRYALGKAATYARSRTVWATPIGAHQGLAHPLAKAMISLELARLMTAKAAWLYDAGHSSEAGTTANMAKYAAAEAADEALDAAIQTHGGNGMATEYGLATMLGSVRATRIAPVSREMILNFVSGHLLGLGRSY